MQEKEISTIIFKIKPQFSKKISRGHPRLYLREYRPSGAEGVLSLQCPLVEVLGSAEYQLGSLSSGPTYN